MIKSHKIIFFQENIFGKNYTEKKKFIQTPTIITVIGVDSSRQILTDTTTTVADVRRDLLRRLDKTSPGSFTLKKIHFLYKGWRLRPDQLIHSLPGFDRQLHMVLTKTQKHQQSQRQQLYRPVLRRGRQSDGRRSEEINIRYTRCVFSSRRHHFVVIQEPSPRTIRTLDNDQSYILSFFDDDTVQSVKRTLAQIHGTTEIEIWNQ